MVIIYVQVSFALEGYVEPSVFGKLSDHVVQKTQAGAYISLALAIQLHPDRDTRLFRSSAD